MKMKLKMDNPKLHSCAGRIPPPMRLYAHLRKQPVGLGFGLVVDGLEC